MNASEIALVVLILAYVFFGGDLVPVLYLLSHGHRLKRRSNHIRYMKIVLRVAGAVYSIFLLMDMGAPLWMLILIMVLAGLSCVTAWLL